MNRTSRQLYFLHINKAGGTSFAVTAARAFASEDICPAGLIPQLLAVPPADMRRYRLFIGHFGTGLFSLLDEMPETLVLLRDPVERAISQFNAHLSNPGTAYHAAIQAHGGDLGRCLDDPMLAALLSDYQTRFLGQEIDLRPLRADPALPRPGIQQLLLQQPGTPREELLDVALERLRQAAVVGVLERFDAAIRRLETYLGLELQPPPRLNISGETPLYGTVRKLGRADFPPAVIDRLEELNAHDRRLYQAALALEEGQ